MLTRISEITYQVTQDENFLKCVSLSGAMGKQSMIGHNFIITYPNKAKGILVNATIEEIKLLPIDTYVNNIVGRI